MRAFSFFGKLYVAILLRVYQCLFENVRKCKFLSIPFPGQNTSQVSMPNFSFKPCN